MALPRYCRVQTGTFGAIRVLGGALLGEQRYNGFLARASSIAGMILQRPRCLTSHSKIRRVSNQSLPSRVSNQNNRGVILPRDLPHAAQACCGRYATHSQTPTRMETWGHGLRVTRRVCRHFTPCGQPCCSSFEALLQTSGRRCVRAAVVDLLWLLACYGCWLAVAVEWS